MEKMMWQFSNIFILYIWRIGWFFFIDFTRKFNGIEQRMYDHPKMSPTNIQSHFVNKYPF